MKCTHTTHTTLWSKKTKEPSRSAVTLPPQQMAHICGHGNPIVYPEILKNSFFKFFRKCDCWKYLDNLGWVSQHQYNFDNVIDERFLGNAQCAGYESQNKSFEQQRLSLKRNIFQPEIDDISLHTIWTEWPVFMMEHKHLNSFEQTIKVRCEIQCCLTNAKISHFVVKCIKRKIYIWRFYKRR